MVWITYKFARVEQNCGRKGGLFNRLRIVETKACSRYLGDFNGVTQPSLRPMPGLREVRMRGCMELRKSKRRRSKKEPGLTTRSIKRTTTACVSFMIKLLRAYGGCLGARRRRRTWQAAISLGEPQAGFDPRISEWGNPAR